MRKLLTAGSSPNHADPRGVTALHVASLQGHIDCVRALLLAGASPNARSRRGKLPFDVAKTPQIAALVRVGGAGGGGGGGAGGGAGGRAPAPMPQQARGMGRGPPMQPQQQFRGHPQQQFRGHPQMQMQGQFRGGGPMMRGAPQRAYRR